MASFREKSKGWALGMAVSVISVFFTLLLIEAYLRVFRPSLTATAGVHLYDRELGIIRMVYREGISNSLGFIDQERTFKNDQQNFRILGVGDSFAYGVVPKDQNYHTYLETRLNEAVPDGIRSIEVINLGVPGYGPYDVLHLLKQYGLKFKPNIVLLGFFMGNDFEDNDPDKESVVLNGLIYDIGRRGRARFSPQSLHLRIYFKALWVPLVEQWRMHKGSKAEDPVHAEPTPAPTDPAQEQDQVDTQPMAKATDPAEAPGFFSEEGFLEIEFNRSKVYCNKYLESEKFRRQWNYVRQGLIEMKSLCHTNGAQLVIALFPDQFVIEEALWAAVAAKYNLNARDYDFEAPAKLMVEFGRRVGLPILDLTSKFKQVGGDGGLYLSRDTHWNKAGNQLAGEELYKFLLEKIRPATIQN